VAIKKKNLDPGDNTKKGGGPKGTSERLRISDLKADASFDLSGGGPISKGTCLKKGKILSPERGISRGKKKQRSPLDKEDWSPEIDAVEAASIF